MTNNNDSFATRIKRIAKKYPSQQNDILEFLNLSMRHGLLEANTLGMLEGVLDVQETRVKDVMVPRSQMVTIAKESSISQIIPKVISSGHSRFPVIGDHKDEVLGVLMAKDLLKYGFNAETEEFKILSIIRPAVFIPEIKRLNVLLQDFRLNKSHMAIVVDEYGRITGLITIEDVLEQIVGDIEDEHDIDTGPSIQQTENGTYIVKALTTLEEFDDYFKCELEMEGVETIGGLVMRSLGHLPQNGESVTIGKFIFNVLRSDSRRINLLNVTRTE